MDISKNMKDNPIFSSLMSNMGKGLITNGVDGRSFTTPSHPDNRQINLVTIMMEAPTKKDFRKITKKKRRG